MGCCCSKKQVAQPEKKKVLTPEEIKNKYKKIVLDYIIQENIEGLRKIIEEGFHPDWIFDNQGQNTTMLILSIVYKKSAVTQFLITFKQNLNQLIKPNNDSALVCALVNEDYEIVNLLLSKGASKSILGPENKTLLQLAEETLKNKQSCKVSQNDDSNLQKIITLLKK